MSTGTPPVEFYDGPPRPSNNGLAIAALALGAFTFLVSLIPFAIFLTWVTAAAAVVLGLISGIPRKPRRLLGLIGAGLGALGFLIGLIITVAVIAAVGSATPDSSPAPAAPQVSASAPAESAPEPAPTQAVQLVTVPDVTDKTGDVAKDAISEANLTVNWDAGNDSVILPSNWTVLSQTPSAGTQVDPDSEVTLQVVKTSTLDTPSADTSSSDEQLYLDAIYAYTGYPHTDTIDKKLITLGNQTCSLLDDGTSIDDIALSVADKGADTRKLAAAVLGSSTQYLCPEYHQEVADWVAAHS